MKFLVLLWTAWALGHVAVAQQEPEGRSFLPPQGGALWRHKDGDLRLPQKLGKMTMAEGFQYKKADFGVSLRYQNAALRARADVYVYPCGRPHSSGDEIKKALMDEASTVLSELELVRRQGTYSAIQNDAATLKEMELHDGGKSGWLMMPIHLTIHEDKGAGVTATRVESLLGLAVYGDYWVKIRYTHAAETGKEGEEARDQFANEVWNCVLAADWCGDLAEWVAAYRKDPLSPEAVDKGGGVVAFANQFPLVQLTIGPSILNLGEACEKHFPEARQDVLRALIVGVTDATVKGKTQAEAVEAGVREVAMLCEAWKKKDPKFTPPSLSEFKAGVAKDNDVELPPSGTPATPGGETKKRRG
jgi:hypothetical protein